ncbi:MAG TPA: hypothetical protein VNA25_29720 [Phycisphaerae bacterium]|nr:hypothetical protein [Phycisphaerae bacterium]HUT62037.1 hypothetical protein [Phycisphaerae bacterium]
MCRMGSVIVIAGVLACAQAAAQTTQPAGDSASPKMQAARKAVAEAVAEVVHDLGSGRLQKREAAQKALTALSESVIAEVFARVDANDLEQVARAKELLATLTASARQAQMMISLTPEQRTKVSTLARSAPESFNSLFSEDREVAGKAAAALVTADAPGSEVVVTWACGQRDPIVRLRAIEAACYLSNPSEQVRLALMSRLAKMKPNERWGYYSTGDPPHERVQREMNCREYDALLDVLVGMKEKRILPRLLRAFLHGSRSYYPDSDELAGRILRLNDKRAIVTLMDQIGNDASVTSVDFGNGRRIGVKRGDLAMAIIIRQTGQSLKEYGFYTGDDWALRMHEAGFESEDKRAAARKKLRDWWDRNKKNYEGVEKIKLLKDEDLPAMRGKLPVFIERLIGG